MLDHLTEMSNSKKQRVELPLGEVTTEKKFELKSIRSAELHGDTFNCSKVPHNQILFLAQYFVVVLLIIFCLVQLALKNSSLEKSILTCAENTIYFTILSTTIGYILPAPRPNSANNVTQTVEVTNLDETDNAIENSSSPDFKFNPETESRSQSVWRFVCCITRRSDLLFLSQIAFVLIMSVVCVLQLSLREPNCEEKTAYFTILSALLTFLLPPKQN